MATMRSLGFSIFSRYDGSGVSEARRDIDSFSGSVNRSTSAMNSWNGRIILAAKSLAVFGPALVPIAANLTAIGGAAAAMGASVGGALTVYGAAMKGAITNTLDAKAKISDLRSELDKQKAVLASLKPGTDAYNEQLKKVAATQKELDAAMKALSPSQRSFIQATDQMSSAWQKFITSTQDKTLATATNVVQGLTAGIGLLKPILDAVHPAILQVSKDFENWMKGDSARNYAQLIASAAVPALQNLIAAGKDVINVLGDGFRAFLPSGVQLSQVLRDGAAALRQWSDGGGFQRFLDYVRETGPQVREFFSVLMSALGNILQIMRELAPFALGLTTAILQLVAALPPEWIERIVQGFIAWKIAMMGLMVIQGVITLIHALRAAWFILNLAFSASAIGLVIIAIAALIAGIVLLIKNWDTVSAALKTAWNAVWNFLKTVAEAVWNALKTAWNTFIGNIVTVWTTVSTALSTAWNAVWNAIKVAADAVWNALQTAWNAIVTAFSTVWTTVSTALSTAWSAVWGAIRTAAETVWNALKTAWDAFINGLQVIWNAVSTALSTAWQAVWGAIRTAAEAVWNALKTAWDAFINGLQLIWNTVSAALSAAWQAVWTAIQTVAQTIWTALQTAWQALWTAIQTIWTTVSGIITAAWQVFWTAIQTVAQTIWTALQTAWNTFLTAIQTVWTTISTALSTAWQTVWTAIQTAAQTIWDALKVAWETFINALQEVWNTVSEALKDAWNTVWNWIKDTAQEIWDSVKQLWDDFINGIKEIWDDVSSALKEAWEAVWNWLKDTAEKIWRTIGEVIMKAVNAIIDVINGIIKAWNTITGAVGLDGLNIGEIPHRELSFAVGGIVGGTPNFAAGGIVNFAAGGVLSGYAPGRDTVPAMLSRGEGILTPEAVRGLGGAGFVHSANRTFAGHRGAGEGAKKLPGFAGGGIVAFGRDPRNKEGWGTSFFAPGGVVAAPPDPNDENYTVGPGGIIIGGESSTSPDASDVQVGDGDPLGVGVLTDGLGNIMKTGAMVLGFIGRAAIEAAFATFMSKLDSFGEAGNFGKMIAGGTKKILLEMIEKLVSEDAKAKEEYEAMSVAGAQSVQAWAPLAAEALARAGIDKSQLPAFLALMSAESGGNPNAINNWDVNAKNGVPSQGLMQVIPTTFAAHRDPSLPNNILDPLANMTASARYIKSRYGGTVPGSPYALGTPGATAGPHLVGELGPELVNFRGGETVTPADETADILSGANVPTGEDVPTGNMAPIEPPAAPADGMPTDMPIESPMLQTLTAFQGPPQVEGWFGDIIAAAQHMLTTVQTAWTGTVAAGSAAQIPINMTTNAVGNEMGVDLPIQMETMATSAAASWTAMNTAAQTNWLAMQTMVFTPAELHMTTTMPAAAVTMQTASDLAWTTMNTTSTAQWTIMRDTTFAEAELHMGTTVPEQAVVMQTASDLAWTTMQETSTTQWTTMKETVFTPFEEYMTTTIPEAATTMSEAVATAIEEMVARLVAAIEEAIAAMDAFIAKAQEMIAAAEAAMAAAAALGAAGGAGGGGGALGAASGDAAAALAAAGISPGMITQGEFSNSVSASAGTHSGGGVFDIAGGPELLPALHAAGFAAWYRDASQGFSPHIHAVYSGATNLSPQAAWQLQDFQNGGSGLGIPGNLASGTNKARRGWTWVGEKGPELMRMRGGEQVMPHRSSMAYANAANSVRGCRDHGGGVNVEFNFNGPVNNGDDVRRAVDEAIPKLTSALMAKCGSRIGG